ncbi:MAG: hypothetical protein IJW64_06475 [Clostridia bacterium]|nr:hypothetical protein [Clostridia bacterium]
MKKIKYVILVLIILTTSVLGTACKKGLKASKVPDYSSYTDQFDFFGYHSAHNGTYSIDGVVYDVGENFMTVEQYQMYKDSGMTIYYPQSAMKIRGEEGAMDGDEDSQNKFYADRANDWEYVKTEVDKMVSVGIKKTILYDEDLSWLGLNEPNRSVADPARNDEPAEENMTDGEREARGLIGEHKDQFRTIEELDAQVEKLIGLYAGYEGVGGVTLADEPKNVWYKSYGDLYNSIKRVCAKNGWNDFYISFNLNPLNLNEFVYQTYYPYVDGTEQEADSTGKVSFEDGFARYKQYIENFMDSMNPDYVRYDDYPLRKTYLSDTYIPCLEYVAGVARDRGIDFHMVTQTFGMDSNGSPSMRKVTEAGANWLNNMLVGFGVREISYFTYYQRSESKTDGESFFNYPDYSFVDYYGNKTKLYDMMQTIMANNQKFAPTVFQFDYLKSVCFTQEPMETGGKKLFNMETNVQTYTKVKKVSLNKECAMVNELYDKKNDRYMYMAMNIVDPDYTGSSVYQTITLEFDKKEFKYALVYKNGVSTLHKLDNGKISVKGAPGDASFIIPFK